MKEIINTSHLSKEIEILANLGKAEIYALNVLIDLTENSNEKLVSTEYIELITNLGNLNFYSLGCTQHWYGEYEIDIVEGTNDELNDLISDSSKRGEKNIDLIGFADWNQLKGEIINEIVIYSAGEKAFNLLRLRNEKTHSKIHYIQFSSINDVLFSIGFYGLKSNQTLEDYSWIGDLRINYKHRINRNEMMKWDLKEIYKKSW
ncbi:hypothetical protein [Crocinitomix catalasitica]|uniref:hypothetical protein n=1 Tax=Crocinitomix catalasitica TaxID=184607 RepID=UPI000484EA49|nr:hypothetical protein [Crocinitomix catalasitica]